MSGWEDYKVFNWSLLNLFVISFVFSGMRSLNNKKMSQIFKIFHSISWLDGKIQSAFIKMKIEFNYFDETNFSFIFGLAFWKVTISQNFAYFIRLGIKWQLMRKVIQQINSFKFKFIEIYRFIVLANNLKRLISFVVGVSIVLILFVQDELGELKLLLVYSEIVFLE